MKIEIVKGRDQCVPDQSIAVVIDVLRAFSTTDVAKETGVQDILLCQTYEEAQTIKTQYPGIVTVGEQDGFQIDGFDLGNSPYYLSQYIPQPKQIAIKTTNGVAAVFSVLNAQKVLVASLRNAKNIAVFLQAWAVQHPDSDIYIICSAATGEEDYACAKYIRALLRGQNDYTAADVIEVIKSCAAAQKFVMAGDKHFPSEDLALCSLERDDAEVLEIEKNKWIELKEATL
ncbi:MAG: 2-phosphosulfolactate phosphatase [Bdellovibrionota bacterium]